MKKRNGIISLWKFLFAIVIAFFHGSSFYHGERNAFFPGGYICVEFFFIVSGFYLAKQVLESKKDDQESFAGSTLSFVGKRIKSFYPYVIIGFAISMLLMLLFRNPSYKLSELANSIWNLLLLRTLGFRSVLIMGQLWYLTAMIIAMFILYPILKKYKENFILYFSPLIVLLGLGYLSHFWLGLDHAYANWNNFICTGLLRAFIEMNSGFLIYMVNQKLKNVEYTHIGKWCLTLIGEGLLLVVLFIISYIDVPKHYDYVMLLFITISITIFVSEKTYEHDVLSVKFFYYLEKLSMPIFINHTVIISFITFVKPFSKMMPKNQSVLTVIITLIFSILEIYIIDFLKRKELVKKIKQIFIKTT